MTSGEKAEPERSAISSSECPQGNGSHCYDHDPACCHCGKPRPEPSTECEGGCRIYSAPPCRDPAKCSCGGEWWKHGCKHSLPPEPRCEGCGHTDGEGCGCPPRCAGCGDQHGPEEHEKTPMCGYCDAGLPMACTCGPDEACGDPCDLGEEPPLTPEEEEASLPEGPEYTPCVCGHIEPEHEVDGYCYDEKCGCVGYRTKPDFEVPPQPGRRPPYLLAYSVQGHLYEVALPGDATVAALDGRLVITHHLGPVAGICQIAPITNEESTR